MTKIIKKFDPEQLSKNLLRYCPFNQVCLAKVKANLFAFRPNKLKYVLFRLKRKITILRHVPYIFLNCHYFLYYKVYNLLYSSLI